LRWQFSEEGKEWRWPSQAKQATSDTPASWSAKRKGKANELKSDPDDDDLFVPRTSTTPSSCRRRSENGGNSDQGGGEDPTLMASRYRISLARPLSPDHFGTFLVQITVRLEDGQDVRLDCIDLGFEALPNRNPEEWSASDVVYYLRSKSLAITADFLTDAHKNPITGRVLLGNNIGNDEVEVLVERTLLLREALEIKKEDTESKERIKLISADLTRMMNEASFLKGPHKFLYERCIKESDLVLSDQVLGEGATAEVRRGVWRNGFIDENVAIKISRMSVDIEGAKGFEKEVRRIKDCRHAHVVECYGMTVTSPSRGALRIGIVMELCQSSLQEYFQGGVPKWRERLRVCLEAARGIAHLHKLAYHHRDIKPANILIAQGGTIKVADFGIARRLDLTHMTNAAKGTERYMSPEALTNQQDELPSDVYSFGCVLFYLMTGHEPWHKYTVSSMRTAVLHDKLCIADVDSDKTSAMEDCPPNFVDLIRECTAFSASARPAISNIISRLQVAMDHTPWESGQLPSFWSKRGLGPEGENRLIEILPHEEEYNLICNRLHDVMPDAAVSKIELNYNPEVRSSRPSNISSLSLTCALTMIHTYTHSSGPSTIFN
jgi:serine/threonine protein kinase